ncbi:MAG: Ppx/GppA family phosphatase [Planctomycetaceae bacterium]|nr:Ppx/GppA family phosphatase [Planctomycetaceae bacterium]
MSQTSIVPTVETPVQPVAVIDVGTTAIRMAVAEVREGGDIRLLESLSQAVSLGKDTFTTGSISASTTEQCVRVLRMYRRVLDQYGLSDPARLRVVATSAVREALNRLTFLDRIFSATGFQMEPIDEAEANRITYLGVLPFLQDEPELNEARCVVAEIGGGSTELLVVREGDVTYSHSYRLGSLRLREMLEKYRTPPTSARRILERQIGRVVDQIARAVSRGPDLRLIALGGDVRFAASQIMPDYSPQEVSRVPVAGLKALADELLTYSEDELIQTFHLSVPDAETIGPGLLAYLKLAQGLGLEEIHVMNVNLRDGLLVDLAAAGAWAAQAGRQVIHSAIELGRKFGFDESHARHVAEMAGKLFTQLQEDHRLEARYELVLTIAALLHEVGLYVGTSGYHKHSMYLVLNSDLFGLSRKDRTLVSLVARYHRRASPKPTHQGIAALSRDERVAISKLAGLLRIAIAIDESRSQRITDFACRREKDRLVISVPNVDDLSLEQLAINQTGGLFEETYGLKVLLRRVRK